jgi:uncharacterized membrane protein
MSLAWFSQGYYIHCAANQYIKEERMTDQAVLNPYSAPTSQVETVSSNDSVVFCSAKKLTAGQGNRIVADAWKIYKTAPFKWTFINFSLYALLLIISLIPILGTFVGSLFYTPLFAGLLIAASEIENGGALKFSHLFAGIKRNAKGVFGLAISITLLSLINMALAFWFLGGEYFMAMFAGQDIDPETLNMNPQNLLLGMMVMLVGTAFFMMLTWFATPLIALQSVGVFQAMSMSFKACLKNWLALTIYGFVMAFWMIVAVIPVGLGLFILLPLLSITIYTSYRKVFTQ